MELVLLAVFVALVILTAATFMRRVSRRASVGVPSGDDYVSAELLNQQRVALTFDTRMFAPNAYRLVVRRGMLGLEPAGGFLGAWFYPSWWFRAGEVRTTAAPASALWRPGRKHDGFICAYDRDGVAHQLQFVPTQLEDATSALEVGGFLDA